MQSTKGGNMKRVMNPKWEVYGEYGGRFSNLDDARICAREASKTPEYNYEASIWNIQDGMNYIDYKHGRCVRDGWTLHVKKTGEKAKFNLDGKIIEKPIYIREDGVKVIKHNNKYYTVNE